MCHSKDCYVPVSHVTQEIVLFQCHISLKRLSDFLQLEEIDDDVVSSANVVGDDVSRIRVSDGTFSWGERDRSLMFG